MGCGGAGGVFTAAGECRAARLDGVVARWQRGAGVDQPASARRGERAQPSQKAIDFILFFIVAVVFFRERVPLPTIVGGALIVAGGLLISVWRVPST